MSELNDKERYKLEIITRVINREIKQVLAAKILGLSTRQIRRLQAQVLDDGESALTHKLKGKVSNHKISNAIKEKILETVKNKYSDFKPTFASEKLKEQDNISVNPETLRLWMSEKKLWQVRSQKKTKYFSWRERKEYFGELQQFDGSYHYWFEDRLVDLNSNPIELCLLASVDDATGKITHAVFDFNEGVIPVFKFWKRYVEKEHGKPLAIYLDKFSTYKINHKNAVDNLELMTQFQRAMRELDIEIINANSPQAKGRIERLFKTLQDRLVKELRLKRISNIQDANIFLKNIFIPNYNNRFSIPPSKTDNIHKSLTKEEKQSLSSVFSIKSQRRINNDFTIQFKNNFYQLKELQTTTVRSKDIVLVEEHLDHSLKMKFKDKYLSFFIISKRPEKLRKQPLILTTHRLNWKPPKNHPWRQYKSH